MEEDVKSQLLNWRILSKNRNMLFGVAILLVMLLHTQGYTGISSWPGFKKSSILSVFDEVISRSTVGVDMFLFLSGMGLYYSFSKCSDLKIFYWKRLKRVLIPYLIIGTGYWILRDLIFSNNSAVFWKDLTWITYYTEGKSTYWYVNFILIMYLIYPLVYYMLESRYRNLNLAVLLAFTFGLMLVLYTNTPELYSNIEKSLGRMVAFFLGCYWGKLVKSGKRMSDMWLLYAFFIPWLGGILQYLSKKDILDWKLTMRPWYGLLAIGICILLSVIFSITDFGKIGEFLNLAGTHSLELYLLHVAMKDLLKIWMPGYKEWGFIKSCLMYLIFVVTVPLLLGIFYQSASKRVGKFLQNRALSRGRQAAGHEGK